MFDRAPDFSSVKNLGKPTGLGVSRPKGYQRLSHLAEEEGFEPSGMNSSPARGWIGTPIRPCSPAPCLKRMTGRISTLSRASQRRLPNGAG
jgi:hypothetical protein